jgi:hypothetical protein
MEQPTSSLNKSGLFEDPPKILPDEYRICRLE